MNMKVTTQERFASDDNFCLSPSSENCKCVSIKRVDE